MIKILAPICKYPFSYTSLLLTILVFFLPLPSYSQSVYNDGAWTFSSDDGLCKLKTLVELNNENRYLRRSAKVMFMYLDNFEEGNACVNNTIPNRSIYTLISPYSSKEFKQGSSALLQSETLLNEQATLQYMTEDCGKKNYYNPDYRVENLLITAIIANEKIRLSTDFKEHDEMSGIIATDGFVKTYSEFLACIDNLQRKPDQIQERQNFKEVEYLKLTPPNQPNKKATSKTR